MRSIVFLILITPLISFSQSFDVDKNFFLDNSFKLVVEKENKINTYIKNYVKNKIDVWQTKDEFEKTSDYRLRVTVSSRKLKAIDLQKEAKKKIINFFVEALKSEYNQIEYLDSGFYSLESYDADNETFLMKIKAFPDDEIVVNIPISFARNVKNNKRNVTIKNV